MEKIDRIKEKKRMQVKFLFFCVLCITALFGNYVMKHSIIQHNRRNAVLERTLSSEKATNRDLTAELNNLQAYRRIASIATEQLNMIFPKNDPSKVQVVHRTPVRSKRSPRVFDFITPSVEAASIF